MINAHAVVIEEGLSNKQVLKKYNLLATKVEEDWHLHIVDVPDVPKFTDDIQKALAKNKPFYVHVYNNGFSLTVIFKDQVYHLNPNNKNSWYRVVRHGEGLGIPKKQLDFYPTRIAEEKEWLR